MGFPLRQGEALHSAENSLFQIRVLLREPENKLFDFLTLGVFIYRAAVFDHRQAFPGNEVIYSLFMEVQHGADLDDAGAV